MRLDVVLKAFLRPGRDGGVLLTQRRCPPAPIAEFPQPFLWLCWLQVMNALQRRKHTPNRSLRSAIAEMLEQGVDFQ